MSLDNDGVQTSSTLRPVWDSPLLSECGYSTFNKIISGVTITPYWNGNKKEIAQTLLSIATELYEHERTCNLWSRNTDGGKRDLLFFIKRAPAIDPQHDTDLAAYEVLLYAIMAKLRELEEDLFLRYKNGFLQRETILHHRGEDCNSVSAFTLFDCLNFFITKWYTISDEPIIDVLNLAVQGGLCDHSNKSVAMIMGELHERYEPPKDEPVDRRTKVARFLALKDLLGKGETAAEDYEDVLDALAMEPILACNCGPGCICAEFCQGGAPVDCVCASHPAFAAKSTATQERTEFQRVLAMMESRMRAKERKGAAGIGKATLQRALERKARAAAAAAAPNLS
ncbi:MAG: hypothetical protein M1812_000081 [Candelaria pacifica]|nr:MAG: hypothetical protein M1812_000081 [Candelaria pacifica]